MWASFFKFIIQATLLSPSELLTPAGQCGFVTMIARAAARRFDSSNAVPPPAKPKHPLCRCLLLPVNAWSDWIWAFVFWGAHTLTHLYGITCTHTLVPFPCSDVAFIHQWFRATSSTAVGHQVDMKYVVSWYLKYLSRRCNIWQRLGRGTPII